MKHYFLNGQEISQAEAQEIQRLNCEYMNSGNFSDLLKIRFIVVSEEGKA